MKQLLQKIRFRKYFWWFVIGFAVLLEVGERLFDLAFGDNDGYVTFMHLDSIITWTQVAVIGLPLLLMRTKNFVVWNVRILIVLVVAMELVFWLLYTPTHKDLRETVGDFRQVGYQHDEVLGYKLAPNLDDIREIVLLEGDTVYDAHISTDNLGRRINPGNTGDRDRYALFFGCSFTFGAGVSDDETMEYYFSQQAPNYRTYNYSGGGWGSNHMYALLNSRNLRPEVEEQDGIAIYTFIDPHIDRAIGNQSVSTSFGGISPYFYLENGELVRNKDFLTGRRRLTDLYKLLSYSNTLKYFNVSLPLNINEQHLQLTAKLIEESAALYREQFGNDNFYVVLYPNVRSNIKPLLEEAGLKVIDLSQLYGMENMEEHQRWRIKYDNHPNPDGHAYYIRELIKQLPELQ